MHKTNCMQSIEQVSTWEVFSSICPYLNKTEMTILAILFSLQFEQTLGTCIFEKKNRVLFP